ncbi:MAG TPA: FAD:protein FMN transferase [Solirubrobacter sp.]|nr:FAD:protein FMN transferase [Solirubrobacter sp.]
MSAAAPRHAAAPGRAAPGPAAAPRHATTPRHATALDPPGPFACFGGWCSVAAAPAAALAARLQLEQWHAQFTRFSAASELSRLNADPRAAVPVSPTLARLAAAVHEAATATGGLVDATLLGEIEAAGYTRTLGPPLPLDRALALAPPPTPAAPHPAARWRALTVAHPQRGQTPQPALNTKRPAQREIGVLRGLTPGGGGTEQGGFVVVRPSGLGIDGGGLAKGLFADLLAERLRPPFAIDCCGDLRFAGPPRRVAVADPFGGPPRHAFELTAAGVATSGIGQRSWLDARGAPAHHLLDPSTGRPAFTGVVQATAIAPTALEAEWRAKAAVLSGPGGAAAWLRPHGGLVVLDDRTHFVIEPRRRATR